MRQFTAVVLLCIPATLLSQQAEQTISPGMSRAQVVAALGAPATQRGANGFIYLFYSNSCGRECGMQDLVILQKDSVTDAIFRSPNRHYTGASSSPEETPPTAARRPTARPMTIRKDDAPATTPPVKPPARANDATPSIPLQQPPLAPAPARPPASDTKTPG